MEETNIYAYEKAEQHINAQAFFIARVMDMSPDCIHIVNIGTGTTVYINKMLLNELGYSAEDIRLEQLDKNFQVLYHEDDVKNLQEFKEKISSATDDQIVEMEARVRAANNTWQWIKTQAKVFQRNEKGIPEKYIGFSQNITSSKLIEEEKKHNAVLLELDRAKTEFFNNVSHEFRTPLSLIISPIQDMLSNAEKNFTPLQVQKLQMVYRNAQRLQKLVNTQLEFSRIEEGRMEAVFQPTDIGKFTCDIANTFRSLIESAGLKLILKCEDVSEPIYVCRDMWENIVLNLISNAFKYTFRGKIEVILRENKNHIQLHVRDTGVGISSANLPKIFERFSRVESEKARAYEGSGIGLALVRQLVGLQGGNIKVKSDLGKGTTFTVVVPKGKSRLRGKQIYEFREGNSQGNSNTFVEQAFGWLAETKSAVRKSQDLQRKEKKVSGTIMIVDDNRDVRLYMKELLSTIAEVVVVENAEHAIDQIEKGLKVNLILTDIIMPKPNGIDFLTWLKEHRETSDIPVVVISGRTNEDAKLSALRAGAVDYITKPFTSRNLTDRVKMHLEKHGAQSNRS
jgi:PAS domain S-box-containing protein